MTDIGELAREYLESWNRRDWDTFRAALAPGYTYMGGDGEIHEGPESGVEVGQMFATAFPDGKLDLKKPIVSGDTAVVEFTASGTHTGDLMDIPPTGKTMSIPVVVVLEFRDGKIVAEREYIDMLHMMTQLGLAPESAAA